MNPPAPRGQPAQRNGHNARIAERKPIRHRPRRGRGADTRSHLQHLAPERPGPAHHDRPLDGALPLEARHARLLRLRSGRQAWRAFVRCAERRPVALWSIVALPHGLAPLPVGPPPHPPTAPIMQTPATAPLRALFPAGHFPTTATGAIGMIMQSTLCGGPVANLTPKPPSMGSPSNPPRSRSIRARLRCPSLQHARHDQTPRKTSNPTPARATARDRAAIAMSKASVATPRLCLHMASENPPKGEDSTRMCASWEWV